MAAVLFPLSSTLSAQPQPSLIDGTSELRQDRGVAVLLALLLLLAAVLASWRSFRTSRERRRNAELETRERIRETDHLTDDLLQGVQGLVLTFHVAAQNLSESHASRKLLDHALQEADDLLSTGRKRFERVAFRDSEEEQSAGGDGDRSELEAINKNKYL